MHDKNWTRAAVVLHYYYYSYFMYGEKIGRRKWINDAVVRSYLLANSYYTSYRMRVHEAREEKELRREPFWRRKEKKEIQL